jgi:hypothetical protein
VRSFPFALVACLLTLLVGAPAAAVGPVDGSRSRVVLRDGGGDVWRDDLASGERTAVHGHLESDLLRATARHRTHAVVVRFHFADLRRVGQQQTQAAFIRTPKRLYLAMVMSFPHKRAGRPHLEDWSPPVDGSLIRCDGLSHHISYRRDVVTLRVPRSCLRYPRWVRVKLHNYTVADASVDSGRTYLDNPHNRQADPDAFTRRIYRGG